MKRFMIRHKLETGQVIPLIVLMLFVIIGMVALILDGGSIMSNRRSAQAAADAGAMAGAQRACSGHDDAKAVAEEFAINHNAATSALATVVDQNVTVTTTVENPSFFSKIFGQETLSATAEATAGCYGPKGTSALPLAFYCRADTVGGSNPENYDCVMKTLNWDDELKPLINGSTVAIDGVDYFIKDNSIVQENKNKVPLMKYIYIIMDDDKVCESDLGGYDCDFNNDGKDELQFSGNRGWIYLTPSLKPKAAIVEGADNGVNISGHQWFTGDPGVMASITIAMQNHDYAGKIVMVPLYNYLCEKGPDPDDPNDPCVAAAHDPNAFEEGLGWPAEPPGGDDFSTIRQTNKDNYHVVTFAPFYISCIKKQGGGQKSCPGFQYAEDNYDYDNSNTTVIEGYFIDGYPVSVDSTASCVLNTGNCVMSISD